MQKWVLIFLIILYLSPLPVSTGSIMNTSDQWPSLVRGSCNLHLLQEVTDDLLNASSQSYCDVS